MTPFASFLDQFSDAVDFLFNSSESRAGGIKVGGSEIWTTLLPNHLLLTAVSVAGACLVAIPLGLWLGHLGRGQILATSVANIGRAIPSYALIVFFVAYLGAGFSNVALALILLAIPPILTNTYVGVRQVDRGTVDAARGMGVSGLGLVRRVELPLALPLMFAGLRVSVVNVVATATLAPIVGYQTLGVPIFSASVYGEAGRLGAAIAVAALAVAADTGFGALERVVTPKGLKLEGTTRSRRRFRGALSYPDREVSSTP